MSVSQSPEQKLASFVVQTKWANLPARAVENAKNAVLDSIGICLAGSVEDTGRIVIETAREVGAQNISGVIGGGLRTSPELAALANGTMTHALDYDDVSDSWIGHPSTVLVPAILAMAEKCHSSGREIITSYVTGFEVGAKLGLACGQDQYARGWHNTGTIGSVAGAAAIARLLKLDATKTQMAMGIAASLAGGLRENFGSMTKPLHAGNGARNAVLAGLLAEKGFTSSENALTGKAAFARVFGQDHDYDFAAVFSQLGSPFDIISPGIWVKAYPSGAVTHSAISAAVKLRQEHSFDLKEVVEIKCATNPAVPKIIIHHHPKTGLEGKFSLEYCVSVALLDGEVSLDSFTDRRAGQDDVQGFMSKIKYVHPPELENKFGFNVPGIVTVVMKNGRELTGRVDSPKGTPANPMTQAELQGKFENCARRVLSAEKTKQVIREVGRLEQMKNVSDLINIMLG
ncbi:MAG: MmgE/PrpD family protein [Chloroflexota bacterium]